MNNWLTAVAFLLAVSCSATVTAEVTWMWSGALTDSSIRVKAKLASEAAIGRLAVSTSPTLTSPLYSAPDTASSSSNNRVTDLTLSALQPATNYYYAIEVNGTLDLSKLGKFRTLASGPMSFTIALGSCSWTGSNSPLFDSIRVRQPWFMCHMGDMHYENIGVNDPSIFRAAYESVLGASRQAQLYRDVPIVYMWDDHDFGPNNSDSTAPGRAAARATYQEYVPHYPLAAGSGNVAVYQAFSVGRVRFIVTDSRSARSPYTHADSPSKTMLGIPQKNWLKQEMLTARDSFALIVWVNTLPWIGVTGDDGWYVYTYERKELADFVADSGITNLCMVSGDAHMIAVDDGTNSDYSALECAAFPVFHAAPLDRTVSIKGGPYSHGAYGSNNQFGILTVNDLGDSIAITFEGRNLAGQQVVTYSKTYRSEWTNSDCLCCDGNTGNTDCSIDQQVDISDLTLLVDHLFISNSRLCCKPEGNTDSSPAGEVDVSDLTNLIDYLFITNNPLPTCSN